MRPKIPDSLAERIRAVYEAAGYATESEFIRDAIRRRIDQVERSQAEDSTSQTYNFEYHIDSAADGNKYPTVYLRPKGSYVYNPEADEVGLVLNTGAKEVNEDSISGHLETLDVVHTASLSEKAVGLEDDDDGWIYIVLNSETVANVGEKAAVSEVLDGVSDVLESADAWESPEERLENVIEQFTS